MFKFINPTNDKINFKNYSKYVYFIINIIGLIEVLIESNNMCNVYYYFTIVINFICHLNVILNWIERLQKT